MLQSKTSLSIPIEHLKVHHYKNDLLQRNNQLLTPEYRQFRRLIHFKKMTVSQALETMRLDTIPLNAQQLLFKLKVV